MISISLISHPEPSHNLDLKIGISKVCIIREAQHTTARFTKGEEYECDMTTDHRWYQTFSSDTRLPTFKQKMSWLWEKNTIVQQDGATPHTGHDASNKLTSGGREGGWDIRVFRQPAQSPDLNVNDLGFVASLKSRVWKKEYESIDEMIEGIRVMFTKYDNCTFERVWQSVYEKYNQVLRTWSVKDFEVRHTGAA